MGFLDNLLGRLFGNAATNRALVQSVTPTLAQPRLARPNELYDTLEAFRDQNELYRRLADARFESSWADESIAPIRNVANRAVEAVAAHLWPGSLPDALPIETDNEAIIEPIQRVFTWSAFGSQKQVLARQTATLGDGFIKVVQREDKSRVYFQLIHPRYVSDFDVDERGFVVYCRIDVPITRREGEKTRTLLQTEIWTKESMRRWEHEGTIDTPVENLGEPLLDLPLSTWAIDFVPIVHIKHRDTGELRGAGVFTHALSKLIEADRVATRMHQMLFRHNKPLWAVSANANDATGRPLTPAKFADADGNVAGQVTLKDETILYLPGMQTMESLIPNVNYAASLDILNAMMRELESDIPELAFYRIRDFGSQLSGYAVRLLLSDAVARIEEARGNAESGLIRAAQMSLTIGKNAGLFPKVGTYEAGELDFNFRERPVVPLSELEEAQAVVLVKDIVGNEESLKSLGKSEDDIKRIMDEKAKAADEAIARQQQLAPPAQQPPPNGGQR